MSQDKPKIMCDRCHIEMRTVEQEVATTRGLAYGSDQVVAECPGCQTKTKVQVRSGVAPLSHR